MATKTRHAKGKHLGIKTGLFAGFGDQKTKKNTFFEKRTGEVTDNKGSGTKNEPKNEAGKLLKTGSC